MSVESGKAASLPETPRKRRRWLGPVVSAGAFLAFLLLSELALRIFGSDYPDPYAIYKPGKEPEGYIPSQHGRSGEAIETEPEPGLPGLSGKHHFKTNGFGFRGEELRSPKPAGEFRIFLVGGSTTECFYLDEEQAISGVLQRALRAKPPGANVVVENAGKDGDKSWDHVAVVVHRLVFLEPDLIVVLAGINDLLVQVAGRDYLHWPVPIPGRSRLPLLLKMTLTESQLARRVYYVLPKSEREDLERITKTSNYRKLVEKRRARPTTAERPRIEPSLYGKNLLTLAGTAKAHGVPLVFLTQPSTWGTNDANADEWQWLQVLTGKDIYRNDFMDEALEAENDEMRRVAAAQGVPLHDLARALPKSLDFMYDDCHFTPKGAEAVGEGLAAFLIEKGLVRGK